MLQNFKVFVLTVLCILGNFFFRKFQFSWQCYINLFRPQVKMCTNIFLNVSRFLIVANKI
jgi:hypothetical protein